MKNNDDITIFLTPVEAERFKDFQRYYELFNFLLDKKVFEQKSASIILNFNHLGNIGSITRNDVLYLSDKKFENNNSKAM